MKATINGVHSSVHFLTLKTFGSTSAGMFFFPSIITEYVEAFDLVSHIVLFVET